MLCFRSFTKAAALALTIAALNLPGHASAQATEEDWQLLNRIVEAFNSVSPETAREAQAKCVELGKEVAARTDMDETQRIIFRAEIEGCIYYAMYRGQYSDETGDTCSHHFASARFMTEAILAAQNRPGVTQEQLTDFRDRVKRASELGPELGCSGDYVGLIASLPATDAIASTQHAGVPDEELMNEISNTTHAVTDRGSEDWLSQCRAYEAVVAERTALSEIERVYFAAQIENCIATTMALGKMSDETGDVCVHHHTYAAKMSEALRLNKADTFFDDGFRQYVEGELTVAMRQGPGMGCTQDYEVLKVE